MSTLRRICSPVLVFLAFQYTSLALQPTFQGVGDLPGGRFMSQAWAVTNVPDVGPIVAGGAEDSSAVQSFIWSPSTGMVGLGGTFGGNGARAISGDGEIVAGRVNGLAYRWTKATGFVGIGDLAGGSDRSIPEGISADGSTIVGHSSSSLSGTFPNKEAFRWTEIEGMQGLGYLPGGSSSSSAEGVSADGSVIVGQSAASGGLRAFRWTLGTGMVSLGTLPGAASSGAFAVSDDGSTIVGASGSEAFRWTSKSGMVALGRPAGATYAAMRGVSGDGSVAVGGSSLGAIIWDEAHGTRLLKDILANELGLDLAGWTLTAAYDVSQDGQVVVGIGLNPAGNTEGWVAVLPEPSMLMLAFPTVMLLGLRRAPHRLKASQTRLSRTALQ